MRSLMISWTLNASFNFGIKLDSDQQMQAQADPNWARIDCMRPLQKLLAGSCAPLLSFSGFWSAQLFLSCFLLRKPLLWSNRRLLMRKNKTHHGVAYDVSTCTWLPSENPWHWSVKVPPVSDWEQFGKVARYCSEFLFLFYLFSSLTILLEPFLRVQPRNLS
jgi:hypothetical protein